MFIYNAKGINTEGKLVTLEILAKNKDKVKKNIRERGLYPLSVEFSKTNLNFLTKIKKIKTSEIINFNRELYTLLKSGLPLLKSFYLIQSKIQNPFLSLIIEKIILKIEKGESFSESVKEFSDVFGNLYSPVLSSGEKSGELATVIKSYNSSLKKVYNLQKRIKKALIYPSFIAVFSIFVFIFILTYIIPRFATFYENFDAQLPLITRTSISVGNFMKNNLIIVALALVAIIIAIKKIKEIEFIRDFFDRFKLKLPFGYLVKDFYITVYSRGLSLLIKGGVEIVKSLNISITSVKNKFLHEKISSVTKKIIEGENLSDAFESTGVFPPTYVEIVKVGENSGALAEMISDATDYLEEKIEETIDSLISLLEPAIIIVMGVLVAGILLSVYLPIFSIARTIH